MFGTSGRLFPSCMMAGRKCDRNATDREIEVSEAIEEEDNVTIHGIVTELSPINTYNANDPFMRPHGHTAQRQ